MINNVFLDSNNVEGFCGEIPEDFQQIEIGNDPNFVFTNDINFDPVQLFDIENNSVFVNSFLECQHYVNGGWNYQPLQINESDYHMYLLYISLLAIITTYFFSKKKLKKIFK
tara:strand:+ start:389 stop:724 length:336 start_codon:yes stop_codon:yes gene_type:complete